jgi:hypothetical protein
MRLPLMKAAQADAGGASWQEVRVGPCTPSYFLSSLFGRAEEEIEVAALVGLEDGILE